MKQEPEMHETPIIEMQNEQVLSRPGTYASPLGSVSARSHLDKACGKTIYPSDLRLPGTLVGKVLHSPYPHCIIHAIHTEQASRLPGVHAILTARDIPGVNKDVKTIADQPFLAEDRARTVMDALALVAAESEAAAQAALHTIRLDLQPIPAVFDPVEALQPEAVQVHPNGNLAYQFQILHGDVEAGLQEAQVIIENDYTFPWIEHAYLETEAALAAPSEDGTLTIWLGSHDIYSDRAGLSLGFGWPEERFRVILLPPGGSFGGKHVPIGFYAALLAQRTNRPVHIHYSRAESLRGHPKRSPMRIHHRLGANKDGRLVAADIEILGDTGAYLHWAPLILDFCSIQATGPYRLPHARVTGRLVYTNNIIASGMRALGTPQVEFAAESQMDQLANRLGMHPLKLRWINALREGDMMITGRLAPGVAFAQTIQAAARSIGLELGEV